MIAAAIHSIFFTYTVLLFIRCVGSWFPRVVGHPVMRGVSWCVDPYLMTIRRIVPPIGGMLDLSPILAYLGLQLVEYLVLLLFR
jgi:YggT family protein